MNREFINKHMSVMFEQTRMMRELLNRMEMYMEEIEWEMEEPLDLPPKPIRVTDFDYKVRPKYCMCDECWGVRKRECDCPECREDASYRMD